MLMLLSIMKMKVMYLFLYKSVWLIWMLYMNNVLSTFLMIILEKLLTMIIMSKLLAILLSIFCTSIFFIKIKSFFKNNFNKMKNNFKNNSIFFIILMSMMNLILLLLFLMILISCLLAFISFIGPMVTFHTAKCIGMMDSLSSIGSISPPNNVTNISIDGFIIKFYLTPDGEWKWLETVEKSKDMLLEENIEIINKISSDEKFFSWFFDKKFGLIKSEEFTNFSEDYKNGLIDVPFPDYQEKEEQGLVFNKSKIFHKKNNYTKYLQTSDKKTLVSVHYNSLTKKIELQLVNKINKMPLLSKNKKGMFKWWFK